MPDKTNVPFCTSFKYYTLTSLYCKERRFLKVMTVSSLQEIVFRRRFRRENQIDVSTAASTNSCNMLQGKKIIKHSRKWQKLSRSWETHSNVGSYADVLLARHAIFSSQARISWRGWRNSAYEANSPAARVPPYPSFVLSSLPCVLLT